MRFSRCGVCLRTVDGPQTCVAQADGSAAIGLAPASTSHNPCLSGFAFFPLRCLQPRSWRNQPTVPTCNVASVPFPQFELLAMACPAPCQLLPSPTHKGGEATEKYRGPRKNQREG